MQGIVLLAVSVLYVSLKWRVIVQKLIVANPNNKNANTFKTLLMMLAGPLIVALATLGASYHIISQNDLTVDLTAQVKLAYVGTITSVLEVLEVIAEEQSLTSQYSNRNAFHIVGASMASSQLASSLPRTTPWWWLLLIVHCALYIHTIVIEHRTPLILK
jgi:hypothetical protein